MKTPQELGERYLKAAASWAVSESGTKLEAYWEGYKDALLWASGDAEGTP